MKPGIRRKRLKLIDHKRRVWLAHAVKLKKEAAVQRRRK